VAAESKRQAEWRRYCGRMPRFLLAAIASFLVAAGGASAQAAFPGSNGQIAYQRLAFPDGTPVGGLFAHAPSRGGAERVLSGNASVESPAYSPDGRLIAFAADLDSVADTRARIYLMNADGSGVREVTAGAQRDGHPSFSPDGRSIVFDRITNGYDHYSHIFLVRVDGSGLRQLTYGAEVRDTDPTFAPNGKTIAFVSERGNGRTGDRFDIFSIRSDGTHLKPLIDGRLKEEEPDFSPDGRFIAFTSNLHDGPNVFVARADGRRVRQLTKARGGCYRGRCYLSPSWAPNGKHIALLAQAGESSNLAVIRPDGSGLKVIAEGSEGGEGPGGPIYGPAWGAAPR
jgi:Tol biopolymer transport system component